MKLYFYSKFFLLYVFLFPILSLAYDHNFLRYQHDPNPVKKLFWILTGHNDIHADFFTYHNLYYVNEFRKWVFVQPHILLHRQTSESIASVATLTASSIHHGRPISFPNFIGSPQYGDHWGRNANYIELNPRPLGVVRGNSLREGLLGLIKILPAIPSPPGTYTHALLLSQVFPSIQNNDGYANFNEQSSLYTADIGAGISRTLTSPHLDRQGVRMTDEELVKSFNDLAHLRGFKTGFRVPLSEEQLRKGGRPFSWAHKQDEEDYINSLVRMIHLGFDAIFFDSAKHVGNYDMGNYRGKGYLPDYQKMQYILYSVRQRTGRNDLSFIGEKCTGDIHHFKNMGLTAGTDWGKADSKESLWWETKSQSWSREYAAGPEVSNDNDRGSLSFETRLTRIDHVLTHYANPEARLPSFMQMHDLFPLNWGTNTHDLMLFNRSFSAFGDPQSHWNNLFDLTPTADFYRREVNAKFAK